MNIVFMFEDSILHQCGNTPYVPLVGDKISFICRKFKVKARIFWPITNTWHVELRERLFSYY